MISLISANSAISFPKIAVWDVFVRVFHWSLVLVVCIAALTGFVLDATWFQIHVWAGTASALLIFVRLIWGALGPTYARLGNAVTDPATMIRHTRSLMVGNAPRHIGHNPLAAAMVLAMVAVVFTLGLSGVIVLGGVYKTGPLAFGLTYSTATSVGELHQVIAIGFLVLITLHIAGAIYESRRTRENLPLAMVTGLKENRPGDHVAPHHSAHPVMAGFLVVGALLLAFGAGNNLAARPEYGGLVQQIDVVYQDECAACHMAFHPSLMTGQNWVALMANLPDHFGEDASLSPASQADITAWLTRNAAETADTKPAHVFRDLDQAYPYTFTKAPYWQQTHQNIAPEVFNLAPVFSRANCAACHSDAETGWFYPANITIPQEKSK